MSINSSTPIISNTPASGRSNVTSVEEMKKGAKIEIIKPEDVDKEIEKEKARKATEEKK